MNRIVVGLALGLLGGGLAWAESSQPAADARYAYGTASFGTFVADSYKLVQQNPADFGRWLSAAYAHKDDRLQGHTTLSFEDALDARARELAATKMPDARSTLELQTASWLHRIVKQTIPRFSLDGGFEFTNAASEKDQGERQCLLQSVLIASLLQKMGIPAGVDMVWSNPQGQQSNMGHAVTVMRLSSGRDILVDASDPTPFIQHSGLFGRVGSTYLFLKPAYAPDHSITGYQDMQGRSLGLSPRPLDSAYLRSQFYYYRGERAPGGFFASQKTPSGLNASAQFFRTALSYNAHNPLATYALGQVLSRLNQADAAKTELARGLKLYQQEGYIPQGPQDAYTALFKRPFKPGS